MKIVGHAVAIVFGALYLSVALFMALFIALMIHGGFVMFMKYIGVE